MAEQQEENKAGLLRSSAVVGVMTMLSRVLGLVRDVVLAGFIGANANADAFFIAFKVPQFLRRLFAEGAFSQAFVPVLSEYRSQRPYADVKALVDRVAGMLGATLITVTGIAVIGAPVLTALFAPGFVSQPYKYSLTSDMIRITFPYLFLISMTGFAGAILNSYGRFAVPAITPIFLNLCLICSALWVSPYFAEPVFALAWAVTLAGILQLFFQVPFLYQLRLLPRPVVDVRDEGVRRVMTLMVPALFGVSVSQINLLLDTVLASFLPTGSISWLYYSDRLAELPLGVFAIAVGTVILPSLSRKHAGKSAKEFAATLDWAVRSVLLISLPATIALVLLAEPILITLFYYGELNERDIMMSSLSLRAYALGLTAFMLIKVLAPGYYARQDLKTPVKIGIIAMLVNMLLNIAFVIPLHYFYSIGHVGLALATSLAAFLNAALLFLGLYRPGIFIFQPGFAALILRYILALLGMSLVILWRLDSSEIWLAMSWLQRLQELAFLCVAGAGVYFILLRLMGIKLADFRGLQ